MTVALGAFALVPTDSLRILKPTKPLFIYLIPLIRIQVPTPRTLGIINGSILLQSSDV